VGAQLGERVELEATIGRVGGGRGEFRQQCGAEWGLLDFLGSSTLVHPGGDRDAKKTTTSEVTNLHRGSQCEDTSENKSTKNDTRNVY